MPNKAEAPTIHDRVNTLISNLSNGNRSAFARAISLSTGALADIVGGRFNKPSFDVLTKILAAYPSVNPIWLLLGDGSMLIDKKESDTNPYPRYSQLVDNDDNKVIMVLRAHTVGDYIRRLQMDDKSKFKPKHDVDLMSVPPSLVGKGIHIVFPVPERSMEPNFLQEDHILCRFVPPQEWRFVEKFSVCALISPIYGLTVARIQIKEQEKLVLCRFDNVRYRDIELPLDSIRQIWLFKWHLTADLDENSEDFLKRKIRLLRQEIDELNDQQKRWIDEGASKPTLNIKPSGSPMYQQLLFTRVGRFYHPEVKSESYLRQLAFEVKPVYEREMGPITDQEEYVQFIAQEIRSYAETLPLNQHEEDLKKLVVEKEAERVKEESKKV